MRPPLRSMRSSRTARRWRRGGVQGDTASLPFFRKAVEQDPEFALAHARLSTVLQQPQRRSRSARPHHQSLRAEGSRQRTRTPVHHRALLHHRRARAAEGDRDLSDLDQTYPNDLRAAREPGRHVPEPSRVREVDRRIQGGASRWRPTSRCRAGIWPTPTSMSVRSTRRSRRSKNRSRAARIRSPPARCCMSSRFSSTTMRRWRSSWRRGTASPMSTG